MHLPLYLGDASYSLGNACHSTLNVCHYIGNVPRRSKWDEVKKRVADVKLAEP